ncbi:MAG: DUF4350 domain-containing protein, partial [Propionibacteriaceae bacterium]|nr:DUF4350 domain-containing protein [Propionibacteriaceae bacterium]
MAEQRSKARPWLIGGGGFLLGLVLLAVLSLLTPASLKEADGSITNAKENGTRAVAEVLRAHDITVTQVTTLDAATAAGADSTLAIWLDRPLSETAAARLRAVPADLVLIVPDGATGAVELLTGGAVADHGAWLENPADADCADPDATAAGKISSDGASLEGEAAGVMVCFRAWSGYGHYAAVDVDGHHVTVVGAPAVFLNKTIALSNGNAALALRVLGRHSAVTWYLPGDEVLPPDPDAALGFFDLLPVWGRAALGLLVLAGCAAAFWRGRRLGPLVPEPLPVAVPASEAAAGLARLYRQAGARGHAAAG